MSNSQPESDGNSILAGVDTLIESTLGVGWVGKAPPGKRRSCSNDLRKPDSTVLRALIEAIYEKIQANWNKSRYHEGSEENLRLEKQLRIGNTKNKQRREVSLERAIVNIPEDVWPDAENWFNQVPVASGLVDPNADGSRRIDLVHKCGDKAYEFIELKVASNTPPYAAMEILKYGLLYLFIRAHHEASRCVTNHTDLLLAKSIDLKVLAPPKYYEDWDLAWLEEHINRGLADFLSSQMPSLDIKMKFSFEQLSLALARSSPWISRRTN